MTVAFLAAASLGETQTKLQLRVFTSTPNGFSVNSTLIYGEKEAILIDPQFLLSEAHRVVAGLLETKKNLTTIYVTHPHSDHYFGLAVLKQAFPEAKIVALPETVAGIKANWDLRYKAWISEYGGNIPGSGPVLPEPLQGKTLLLEGEKLEITGGMMGDAPNNSMVWIPSLHAVIAGDILFADVHFNVPREPARKEWAKSLERIAALKPAVVIPGHQSAGSRNDLTILDFMKAYMRDFDAAAAASKSAAEFATAMKGRYPNIGMERSLISAAEAAFPAQK
jgi:glyoxylase-like metal-dependent hydrolase (beta-lactamase superfamily II)